MLASSSFYMLAKYSMAAGALLLVIAALRYCFKHYENSWVGVKVFTTLLCAFGWSLAPFLIWMIVSL